MASTSASHSASLPRRRKVVTYGRLSSKHPGTLISARNEVVADSLAPSASRPSPFRATSEETTEPITSSTTGNSVSQHLSSTQSQYIHSTSSEYDVPSSDDEALDRSTAASRGARKKVVKNVRKSTAQSNHIALAEEASDYNKVPTKKRASPGLQNPEPASAPSVAYPFNATATRLRTLPKDDVVQRTVPVVVSKDATVEKPLNKSRKATSEQARSNKGSTRESSVLATPEQKLPPGAQIEDTQRTSTSRSGTPQTRSSSVSTKAPPTPLRSASSSDGPNSEAKASMIPPKHTQMWSQLLGPPDINSNPNALELGTSQTSVEPSNPPVADRRWCLRSLDRSVSDTTDVRRGSKRKLVDMLKEMSKEHDDDQYGNEETPEASLLCCPTEPANSNSQPATDERPLQRTSMKEHNSNPEPSQVKSHSLLIKDGPHKITYRTQRSHLAEDNLDKMFEIPIDVGATLDKHNRENITISKLGPFHSLEVEEEELENGSGVLHSIHELRAQGRSKRAVREIEMLLGDTQDRSPDARSGRRNAWTEIASKMNDKAFVKSLLDHGFDQQLYTVFNELPFDTINAIAIAIATAFALDSACPTHTVRAVARSGLAEHVTRLLSSDLEMSKVVKDRKNNMSKSAQRTFMELYNLALQSSLWATNRPRFLTPRIVALKALELLVRNLREAGDMTGVLEENQVETLISILSKTSDGLCSLATDDPGMLDIGLTLSTLESLALAQEATCRWSSSSIELLPGSLQTLIESCESLKPLSLRLCLNLTNNDPRLCEVFSTEAFICAVTTDIVASFGKVKDSQFRLDEQPALIDTLILSLGVVINLVEWSGTARAVMATRNGDLLSSLLKPFTDGLSNTTEADSIEDSQINVARGYLAVLLGDLCQTPSVRDLVREGLPEHSIGTLAAAVEEFIQYHRKVDEKIDEGEEGKDVWMAFTARLQLVADRLKTDG